MSIIKSLTKIATDDDWGDFMEYDLKITKEGSGKDTRYVLTPLPHKSLAEKVTEALKRSPVRLEALYDGGDPWTDLTAPVDEVTGEVIHPSSILQVGSHSIEDLSKALEAEGIDTGALESYLDNLCAKKKKPVGYIVGSAMQLFKEFKTAYSKELERRSVQSELAAV